MTNKNIRPDRISTAKKTALEFLPKNLQTAPNEQIITGTIDRMVSSGDLEPLDAFAGRISGRDYNPDQDVFLSYRTTNENAHSVAPAFVHKNGTTLYHDFIETLKQQNISQYALNEAGLSFAPPISMDMIVNYPSYYWLQSALKVCVLDFIEPFEITSLFSMNSFIAAGLANEKTLEFKNGMRVKFNNATSSDSRYHPESIYEIAGIGAGFIKLIEIYDQFGKLSFDPAMPYTPVQATPWDSGPWDDAPWDGDTALSNNPEYVVIDRSAFNRSPWSLVNSWVHIDVLKSIAAYIGAPVSSLLSNAINAKKPIIQFDGDVELYNYDYVPILTVDVVISGINPAGAIVGQTEYENLTQNSRVLFLNSPNATYNNKVFRVGGLDNPDDNLRSITLTEILDPESAPSVPKPFKYLAVSVSSAVEDQFRGTQFVYRDSEWAQTSVIKLSINDLPKFELYHLDGRKLSALNGTSFAGSQLLTMGTDSDPILTDLSETEQYTYQDTKVVKLNGPFKFKRFAMDDAAVPRFNSELQTMWKPTIGFQPHSMFFTHVHDTTPKKEFKIGTRLPPINVFVNDDYRLNNVNGQYNNIAPYALDDQKIVMHTNQSLTLRVPPNVYFTTPSGEEITDSNSLSTQFSRTPWETGLLYNAPTIDAIPPVNMLAVHVDDQYLYFGVNAGSSQFYIRDKETGAALSTIGSTSGVVTSFATDDQYLYVTRSSSTGLKYSIYEKSTLTLVSGLPDIMPSSTSKVMVDDEYVYYVSQAAPYMNYLRKDNGAFIDDTQNWDGTDAIRTASMDDSRILMAINSGVSTAFRLFDKATKSHLTAPEFIIPTISNVVEEITNDDQYWYIVGQNRAMIVVDKETLEIVFDTGLIGENYLSVSVDDYFVYVTTNDTNARLKIFNKHRWTLAYSTGSTYGTSRGVTQDEKAVYVIHSSGARHEIIPKSEFMAGNTVTIKPQPTYEADSILMVTPFQRIPIIIKPEADQFYDGVVVKHNGKFLEPKVDYTVSKIDPIFTSAYIKITKKINKGDITDISVSLPNLSTIELLSETERGQVEIADVVKYNATNDILSTFTLSELTNHYAKLWYNSHVSGKVIGSNTFYNSAQRLANAGTIMRQPLAPDLLSYMTSLPETFEDTLFNLTSDYVKFKKQLINTIKSLAKSETVFSFNELFSKAILAVQTANRSIGKYQYSGMVFGYNEPTIIDIDDIQDNTLPLDFSIVIGKHNNDHLSITAVDGNISKPLIRDTDYVIENGYIQIISDISLYTELHVFKIAAYSECYIPYSMPKLGLYPFIEPTFENGILTGHDYSITRFAEDATISDMDAPTFSIEAAALYHYEVMVYNNIFKTSDDVLFPHAMINGYVTDERTDGKTVLYSTLLEHFDRWKRNVVNLSSDTANNMNDYDVNDKLTYNYSSSLGTNYPSAAMAYLHYYGTIEPHKHPELIVGQLASELPSNPWSDNRATFIGSMDAQEFAYHKQYEALEFMDVVSTDGELLQPVFNVNTARASDDILFGRFTGLELQWKETPYFITANIVAAFKSRPLLFTTKANALGNGDTLAAMKKLAYDEYGNINPAYSKDKWFKSTTRNVITDMEIMNVTTPETGYVYDVAEFEISNSIKSNVMPMFTFSVYDDKPNVFIIDNEGDGLTNDIRYSLTGTDLNISLKANMNTVPYVPKNITAVVDMSSWGEFDTKLATPINGFTDPDIINPVVLGTYYQSPASISTSSYNIVLTTSKLSTDLSYSAVNIVKTGNQYKIDGYGKKSYFDIIKPVRNKTKQYVVNNVVFDVPTEFTDTVERIEFGSSIDRTSNLIQFIAGLGEAYRRKGYHTENWIEDSLKIISGKETTYSLSLGSPLKITTPEFGRIDTIRRGQLLAMDKTIVDTKIIVVDRLKDDVVINSDNVGYFNPSLVYDQHIVEMSDTDANMIMYKPAAGIMQSRIKLMGFRTAGWKGTTNIDGYSIKEGGLIMSFDTLSRELETDMNNDVSLALSKNTRDVFRHSVGYANVPYLSSPLLAENTKYATHIGSQKYKGTMLALSNMFKNRDGVHGANVQLDEEWMIHLGEYGDKTKLDILEIELLPEQVAVDRPAIRLENDWMLGQASDAIIDINKNDSQVVNYPENFEFPTFSKTDQRIIDTASSLAYKIRNAGTPLVSEADYYAFTRDDFDSVFEQIRNDVNISTWNQFVPYRRGDIVRKDEHVYKLNVAASGLESNFQEIIIRGTRSFPFVDAGSTVVLDGNTITINNEITVTDRQDIVVNGTVVNPLIPDGTILSIDGITITLTNPTPITTYDDIVYVGTVLSPTFVADPSNTIIIDAVTVTFDETAPTSVDITAQEAIEGYLTPALGSSRINAFATLRTAYLSEYSQQDWESWLETYFEFGTDYEFAGINTIFLSSEISAAPSPSLISAFQTLLSIEISMINQIAGTSYIVGDFVSTTDENTVATAVINSDYGMDLSIFWKTGAQTLTSTVITQGTVVSPITYNITSIVDRINAYNIPNVTADATPQNALRITKVTSESDSNLFLNGLDLKSTIGWLNTPITIPATTSTTVVGEDLNAASLAVVINNAGVPNVSAFVGTGPVLSVRSTNATLGFGFTTGHALVGLPTNTVIPAVIDTITQPAPSSISSIVNQINAASVLNVSARQADGNLIISSTNSELVIGEGTANDVLGIRSGITPAPVDVRNEFNPTMWTIIPDPIISRIWVADNISSISSSESAITQSGGWDMYQTMDVGLSTYKICQGIVDGDYALIHCNTSHNLQRGDMVLITGTNSTPNLDGIREVTGIVASESGPSVAFYVDGFIAENGTTGKILPLRSVKFSDTVGMNDSLNDPRYAYRDGDTAYCRSGTGVRQAWSFVEGTLLDPEPYFTKLRDVDVFVDPSEYPKLDMYDADSKTSTATFELYDPAKGIFLSSVLANIDNISQVDEATYAFTTDPAVVTVPTAQWTFDKVGTRWWDTSKAIFLEYEQDTIDYRQQNWAKLFPASTIEVFEWIESPVSPDEYVDAVIDQVIYKGQQLSGKPRSRITSAGDEYFSWSESTKFDKATGQTKTVYYFWVSGKTTIAGNSSKQSSVAQIATQLQSPDVLSADWFAPIAPKSFIINGVAKYVSRKGKVVQIVPNSDAELHREFMLLSKQSTKQVPEWLHKRLKASISKYNDAVIQYEWFDWDSGTNYTVGDIVKYDNQYYRANVPSENIIPLNNVEWTQLFNVKEIEYNSGLVRSIIEVEAPKTVPDVYSHRANRYGNDVTKRHTWFNDVTTARKVLTRVINDQFIKLNLHDMAGAWEFFTEQWLPTDSTYSDLIKIIDYKNGDLWNKTPDVIVDIQSDVYGVPPLEGKIVEVRNGITIDGIRRKERFAYINDQWTMVYKYRATVQITDDFWNYAAANNGFGNGGFGVNPFDVSPAKYFGKLLDFLYNDFYVNDLTVYYKDIWFALMEYSATSQNDAYWAIKSTYILADLITQVPDTQTIIPTSTYIEDVMQSLKPFHSKVRLITERYTVREDVDNSLIGTVDAELTETADIDIVSEIYNLDELSTDEVYASFTDDVDYLTSSFDDISTDVYYDDFISTPDNRKFDEDHVLAHNADAVSITIDTDNGPEVSRMVYYSDRSSTKVLIIDLSTVTELSANLNSKVGEAELLDGSAFPSNGYLLIGNELVYATSIDADYASGLIRTKLNDHDVGTIVYLVKEIKTPPLNGNGGSQLPLLSAFGYSVVDPNNPNTEVPFESNVSSGFSVVPNVVENIGFPFSVIADNNNVYIGHDEYITYNQIYISVVSKSTWQFSTANPTSPILTGTGSIYFYQSDSALYTNISGSMVRIDKVTGTQTVTALPSGNIARYGDLFYIISYDNPTVTVYDSSTQQVADTGTITVSAAGSSAKYTAVDDNYLYVRASTVLHVFDRTTFASVTQITGLSTFFEICLTASTLFIYSSNHNGQSLRAYEIGTWTPASIPIFTSTVNAMVADDNYLYLGMNHTNSNNEDAYLYVMDAAYNQITAADGIPPCTGTVNGLYTDDQYVYAAHDNNDELGAYLTVLIKPQ